MTNSFGLSDKMNDAEAKCLSCGAPLPAGREGQQKFTGGRTRVLVLGGNDEKTLKLLANAKEAVKVLGRSIEVEHVEDDTIIGGYNLRSLPALVINGSIVSQGIVSDVDSMVEDIEFLG